MQDGAASRHAGAPGVSRWAAELGTALFVIAVGGVVLNGSLEQGIGWSTTGPESGYFPFYIGLLIIACGFLSAVSAVRSALRERGSGELFLEYAKFKPVLHVLVPMAIYVVCVRWLGLYIASALFIGLFMAWHGRYRWQALWVALGTPLFFYLVLELWFKIDLYKGPLLAWLIGH